MTTIHNCGAQIDKYSEPNLLKTTHLKTPHDKLSSFLVTGLNAPKMLELQRRVAQCDLNNLCSWIFLLI